MKAVAKSVNFQWRAANAGDTIRMEWYARYLEGQKNLGLKILGFKEHDAKATKVLKEWMVKFGIRAATN